MSALGHLQTRATQKSMCRLKAGVPKVSKGDAQKVVTIIRSDKAKTQTYCKINEVSEQMNQAYGKNDKKKGR